MDKKRLLELAGVQLNEQRFTYIEQAIIALFDELTEVFEQEELGEMPEDAEVSTILWEIIEKYKQNTILRRIIVGAKRQRGE